MKSLIPEVFIIESLRLEDEEQELFEGEIIKRMLKLSGKVKTKYFYIRTERELEEIIDLFEESNYRYLHISCHADKSSMATTFDSILFRTLGEMLAPIIKHRRVFVSACEMANNTLAGYLIPKTGCYSVIGPKEPIDFDDAAAFWVSFYHLMFKANETGMGRKDLKWCVTELAALYQNPINYYAASKKTKQGYVKVRTRKI